MTHPSSDVATQYRILRDKVRQAHARHAHLTQELRKLPELTPDDVPVNKAYRDGWNALRQLVMGIVADDRNSHKAP